MIPIPEKLDRVLSLTYDGNLNLEDWFGDIAAMLTPTGP